MRRSLLTGVAALALAAVLSSPADAAAPARATSPHRYLDARGDGGYGRTDILRVTVDNGPRIVVTVRMVDAIRFSEWGTRISAMAIPFNNKAAMEITAGSATFGLGGPTPICPVRRRFEADAETYVFSMNRECLRDPARVRVFVQTTSAQPDRGDRAPNRSWSPWVAERR